MPDRFISPGLPPTPHQREVADVLIEECAEVSAEALTALADTMSDLIAGSLKVQQRTTKLTRFGLDEVQPGQPFTNSERLGMEVGDLFEVIEMAIACGLITRTAIDAGRARKKRQLGRFMQTSLRPEPPCA